MKKAYITPTTLRYTVKTEPLMGFGSPTGENDDYIDGGGNKGDYKGEGDSGILSRRRLWDEDEY